MTPWLGALEAVATAIACGGTALPQMAGTVPLQGGTPERWSLVARSAAAINVLLLLGLSYVWGRNYVALRSKHALGLLVFALLLLARNGWALYVYQFDPLLAAWFASEAVPDPAWHAMLLLHLFETAALLFLGWITWD